MNAWICESCGAKIKQKEKPKNCPLCNRRFSFSQIELQEKSDEASKKYEEALKKLEEYEGK